MKKNIKIRKIYILSFFFSLHIALSAYINSTFLSESIGEKNVGILYAISSFIILLILSHSSYILNKIGNRRLILFLLFINMIGLIFIIKASAPLLIAIGFIAFQATNTMVFFSLDIFIEHFTNPKTVGKSRGAYLTILNAAWIMSPILAGFLITKEGGYETIYLIALITVMIMTVGLMFMVRTFHDAKYKKTPFYETYKYLEKNSHIFSITAIFFILNFFYSWMVIYTPIYLNQHIGLGWDKIGIIFTIMLVPFILIPIPIGKLIDRKKIHKKNTMAIGIVITALATLAVGLTTSTSIMVWAIILFFTRVGASTVATASDVYFFTHVTEEEANLLSLWRDMQPLSYLVAPLLGTAILAFVDIKYMFFILAFIVIFALRYIPKLIHSHNKLDPKNVD